MKIIYYKFMNVWFARNVPVALSSSRYLDWHADTEKYGEMYQIKPYNLGPLLYILDKGGVSYEISTEK